MQFHKILENVFNLSPDPNLIVDELGNILKANAVGQQLFCINGDYNKNISDFFISHQKEELLNSLSSDNHKKIGITGYTDIPNHKGDVENYGYRCLYDPENNLWLIGLKRTKLIAEKQVWHLRINSLIDNEGEAIIAISPEGVVQGWSKGATKLLGYSQKEMVGKHISSLSPSEKKEEAKFIVQTVSKGKRVSQLETYRTHKDGYNVNIVLSCSPVYNVEKKLIGLTAILLENQLTTETQLKLQRQATIIENATDAIITETEKGIIDSWNKGAENLYGYQANEVLGKHISIIHPTSLEEEWQEHQEQILQGKSISKFFTFRKHKNGKEIPVVFSATPLLNFDEKVRGIASITRDMSTEYSEQLLNQQLSSIVRSSKDGIYSCDINGNIKTWNKGAEEIFGYSETEIIGKNISVLYKPEQVRELENAINAINGLVNYKQVQTERLAKNGKTVNVSITISPLFDNQENLIGASIIVRNITDLIEIQNSLEQGLEVQEIINQILTLSHYETNVNKLYPNVLSLIKCLPFSTDNFGIAFIGKRNEKNFIEASLDTNISSECLYNLDDILSEDSGSRITEINTEEKQCYIYPISYNDHLITTVVYSFSKNEKLTARDKDLINLTCTHLNLIVSACHTRTELDKNLQSLKKANEQLDNFAYVVSHDLKSPLKNIALLSEWIKEDLDDNISPEVEENINLLQARVKRLSNIIYGVLEYSKVGKVGSPFELITPLALVNEVIDNMFIPDHVKLNIDASERESQLDRLNMTRIIQNLVENAIKYNDKKVAKIDVTFKRDGQNFEIKVKDNGPGIDPRFHKKVFGIFQTISTKDENESTGIGLSLVKKIVDENNAEIKLNSTLGNGAEFIVSWKSEIEQP